MAIIQLKYHTKGEAILCAYFHLVFGEELVIEEEYKPVSILNQNMPVSILDQNKLIHKSSNIYALMGSPHSTTHTQSFGVIACSVHNPKTENWY